jgi:UrcA family protein
MNARSILSGRFGARQTAGGAVLLVILVGFLPARTFADQPAATTSASSLATVPLSDLNLSTVEGMRMGRDRLHDMAEHLCADRGAGREPSSLPALRECVENTVTNALRQVDLLRRSDMTARNSVTLATSVSLADLDLSTLEGASTARQRLEAVSQRLCRELGRRQELAYLPDNATCVHDSLTAAWAQANVIRLSNERRTAQRATP